MRQHTNTQPDSSRTQSHMDVMVRTIHANAHSMHSIVFNYLNEKRQSFAQAREFHTRVVVVRARVTCVCACVCTRIYRIMQQCEQCGVRSAEYGVLKCCAVFGGAAVSSVPMCHI